MRHRGGMTYATPNARATSSWPTASSWTPSGGSEGAARARRGAPRRGPALAARPEGQLHRLAALAPRPGPGRPHQRPRRRGAGVDRAGLGRAVRAALHRRRRSGTARSSDEVGAFVLHRAGPAHRLPRGRPQPSRSGSSGRSPSRTSPASSTRRWDPPVTAAVRRRLRRQRHHPAPRPGRLRQGPASSVAADRAAVLRPPASGGARRHRRIQRSDRTGRPDRAARRGTARGRGGPGPAPTRPPRPPPPRAPRTRPRAGRARSITMTLPISRSRSLSRSALWLCRSDSHQWPTTYSGTKTATRSLRAAPRGAARCSR